MSKTEPATGTTDTPAAAPAVGALLERGVGRLVGERPSACALTECAGKPECQRCTAWRLDRQGMPASADERKLRRMYAWRVGMPGLYEDDGEASGSEHGISIDFMREPVADIAAKVLALEIARRERLKTPNVRAKPGAVGDSA